jgi:hypothetical protein
MALTPAATRQLVRDTLVDHYPWEGDHTMTQEPRGGWPEGKGPEQLPDTRTVEEMQQRLSDETLAQLVNSYQDKRSRQTREQVDVTNLGPAA